MKNNKRNHIIILLLLIISFSVEAGVNVIGGLSKLINAEPGGTYRGTIVISNPGAEPQQVKVYQTDREYNFKGRTHYGSPGENPRSNAEWITFNADIFTIPAKDRFKLEYEVRIPNNTSLMGTYWSMVMIEGIEEPDDSETSEGTIMVRSVSRTGIQITTNIGDTGSREIEFLRSEIINENGSRSLRVDIENIGEMALKPAFSVELFSFEGIRTGVFEGDEMSILPGSSRRYAIDLSDVPNGKYKALIIADCGGDYVFGANYTLDFKK